tara:strand:+ start:930 stop:1094 length:165 start_codon:yes stop_codon:yes gene_type:complete
MANIKDKDKRQKAIIQWAIKNPEQLTGFIEKLLISFEVDELTQKILGKKYNKKN